MMYRRMGQTPIGVVRWRQGAIAKLGVWTVPRPKFHQCVNPENQMVDGHVAPDVPHRLLARVSTAWQDVICEAHLRVSFARDG